ncbi:hypothetical protein ABZ915_21590 [Streptomyces sp. NPDC046915]|uniref:SCO2400 family protein n=1 Tax=Streptomyces sp. NPDC046915 TaxID=3155257 RepID=UPI0033C7C747
MDYCSSCRRHLNGALMCPGCGAYAPDLAADIAVLTADTRPTPAPAPAPAAMTGTAPWEAVDEAPRTDPSAGLQDVPPAPQGRAARRRQLARWKKNQRRAVVATAVALVGGGLTVSAMDRHSTDRAQAATAPDTPSMPTTPAADEPTSRDTRSDATRPDAHRSSPTRSVPSPATGLPQGRSTQVPLRTTLPGADSLPRTTPTTHPAPAARTAATPAPQQHAGSPSSSGGTAADRTGTSSQQTSAPASGGGTDPGTPQATPSPATPSSPELCLLVVCLG